VAQAADTPITQGAAAILLVVPTLLSLYIVRPGEHSLTTRLLGGLRFLGVTCSALTAVAAASLVGTDRNTHIDGLWWWLKWTALAIVIALTFSLVASMLSTRAAPPRGLRGRIQGYIRRRLEGIPPALVQREADG
jgi:hypothetical protein